jgi:hypothetical protein
MPRGALLVAAAVVGAMTVGSSPSVAWATTWKITLATGSKGETHAQALPAAPTAVTAACAAPTTAKTITVTWTAVIHATAYAIWQSTTSANGTESSVATGVTGTTWTSSALTAGTNYWFKVVADVGSNWASANSSASAESTINSSAPFCQQP